MTPAAVLTPPPGFWTYAPNLAPVKPLAAYPTRRPRHLADLRSGEVAVLPELMGRDHRIVWHGPCRIEWVKEYPERYLVFHAACHALCCGGVLNVKGDARFHGAHILTMNIRDVS